jgi:hypothetical protein
MDMKQVAGQFTYGKRISYTAALGISADEDVDAASIEGESGNATTKRDVFKNNNSDKKTIGNPHLQINAELWKDFNTIGNRKNWKQVELNSAVGMLFGLENPKMMTRGQWLEITNLLKSKDKNEVSIVLLDAQANREMEKQS